MITTPISPTAQPIRVFNSSRFLATVAVNPLDIQADQTTPVTADADTVELSPLAQTLLDYYQDQYLKDQYYEDRVFKRNILEKIINDNYAQDIITASALQTEIGSFDPSAQLLNLAPANDQSDFGIYSNTLVNTVSANDNTSAYEALLELQANNQSLIA